jgi:hypothetical protein
MPRPSLYLDECVPQDVAPFLLLRGFDLLTAREAGVLGVMDDVQLSYAAEHGRVIISHNIRDFRRLHRAGISHDGIFLVPVGVPILLDVRIALLADWVAPIRDHHSRLFQWHELQQRLIHGERIPGYSEEEVRRALGHRE